MGDVNRRLLYAVCLMATHALPAWPAAAQAVRCNPTLLAQAVDNSFGYAPRGDRCEGIFSQKVSAQPIELISVTEYFADFDLRRQPELEVTWPRPASVRGPVSIAVRGLSRELHYAMDTERKADESRFRWATEVLRWTKLGPPSLGATGTTRAVVGGRERLIYLPLRIGAPSDRDTTRSYVVKFYPRERLDSVFVTLVALDERGAPVGAPLRDHERLKKRWHDPQTPIVVTLADPGAAGFYRLEVSAVSAAGDKAVLDPIYLRLGDRPER
jgi:hypothetical protein